jgi:hypothetical protein
MTLADDEPEAQQDERYNFSDVPSLRFGGGSVATLRDWNDGDPTLQWGSFGPLRWSGARWTDIEERSGCIDVQVLPGPHDVSLNECLIQHEGYWSWWNNSYEARRIEMFSVPSYSIAFQS